jgi:DNA-binding transcriptional MerR regulator
MYTIAKLAALSGLTTRALRHYDRLGLLCPQRMPSNGYRLYGPEEVDRLQQILIFRELGLPLDEIKDILADNSFDAQAALRRHLTKLKAKQQQLETLISSVEKTIKVNEGEITMTDHEKFEGFKQQLVADNERCYGQEARQRYGDEAVNQSNAKMQAMSQAQHAQMEALTQQLNSTLAAAVAQGDPASDLAQKACQLHKEWLCQHWSSYHKQAHVALAQTYVDDPRFTAYYDKIAPGAARFLRDALVIYCR